MRRPAAAILLGLTLALASGPARSAGAPAPASGMGGAPAIPADSAAIGVVADSAAVAMADSLARADSLAAVPPRDYLAEVRANFTPENRAYSGTRVVLAFLQPVFDILLMLVLLFAGLSARLRDIAHNLGHRRYVRVLVYFALFTLVTFVVGLPIAWYGGFALEHQYHLSNQKLGEWLTDEFKNAGFTMLFLGVVPLLALAYRALERHPRRWWLWLAGGSVPVIVAAALLSPLVYDPYFNKFTPLRDPVLKQEILGLAEKAGIPGRNVFEVNKSEQTKKFNAYVSGFGASQRIVLYDTILEGMQRDEILFVMGHEMGHYRLGHIWKGIAFYSLMSLVLFFLAGQIVGRALARFGRVWGIHELHDVASMPLFVIALTILSSLAQPGVAAFSRRIEHESDIFGLEVTRSNDAAARAFLKLGSQNRNNPEPTPFVRAVLYDHPPLVERIRFALEYRPWEKGEPAKFYRP